MIAHAVWCAIVSPLNRKAGLRRLVDMAGDPQPHDVESGPRPPGRDWEQTFPIGENAAYVQRYSMDDRDKIVEWAVVQLRRVQAGWRRVAVYDCCHGKGVHVHFFDSRQVEFAETPLRPVDSDDDLVAGLDYAVDRVVKAWRENERRSERGY